MFLQGTISFLCTIGIQTKVWKRILQGRRLQVDGDADDGEWEGDVDVIAERVRVLNSDPGDDVLQVKNLFKRLYKFVRMLFLKFVLRYNKNSKQAVDSLTFGVKKSECFGLLGKFEPENK